MRGETFPAEQGRFPETRTSAVLSLKHADSAVRSEAYGTIVSAYWKPVYKYVRLKWNVSKEDAEDLTQGFFARALEKQFFGSYDAAKGSFRTYLRTCLDRFVSNARASDRRIKRGGDSTAFSLDFDTAESELLRRQPQADESIEEYFRQEWVRSLMGLAVEALRQNFEACGKRIHFQLFERYDLHPNDTAPASYDQLARELGLSATQVTNFLAAARREFRRIVLGQLREMTASEDEFRNEARALLGVR